MVLRKKFVKVELKKPNKKVKDKEKEVSKELDLNSEIMFIERSEEKKIKYSTGKFSLLVAMQKLKVSSPKPGAVVGLIETDEGIVITKQAKKPFNKNENKFSISFSGLMEESKKLSNPIIHNLKHEMLDELLLDLDEVHFHRFFEYDMPEHHIFAAYMKSFVDFEDIMKRSKRSKDSWEIEEIKAVKLNKLKKMKDLTLLLKRFLERI